MKRYFVVPVIATLLLAGVAVAQTTPNTDEAGNPATAAGDGWHGHRHMGFRHHVDPLANLQKPLTADSVKQALTDWFSRQPQVKSVTDRGDNVLVVEIVDRDGKTHSFELNKTTGARRPSW